MGLNPLCGAGLNLHWLSFLIESLSNEKNIFIPVFTGDFYIIIIWSPFGGILRECSRRGGFCFEKNIKNGITAVIIENHNSPVVSAQIWVKVGSINETKDTSGLSHFLEHLIFKGSKNYPGDMMTRLTETQGGVINAATSKEFTQFHIDIVKEKTDEAIKMLCDAMENAVFPIEEIEKERPVVIEEIVRHDDSPDAVLYEMLNKTLFIKTPYRDSVIGSSDVIKNVSREKIKHYYKSHYTPSNMFVIIAGDINSKDVLGTVETTFGKIKRSKPPAEPALIEKIHKPVVEKTSKNVEHTYFMSGFLGPTANSSEQFAADIVSSILGGGRSSRLVKNLREDKKLVYGIGASFWSQRGSGIFAVSATFDPKNEQQVLNEIKRELDNLAENGPTDEELSRVKEMTISQWVFANETAHDKASLYGYWHIEGNPKMAETYLDGIRKTTREDLKHFLKKHYLPQGLNRVSIEPKSKN